ncbi:MAG: carboxypeptidase-like regulatory domain-containing protein [Bacteroidota bacterium]|nr:carboxypeptidase-like regulatory domain-containing protein [Bacteroidota bacterium]
MKNLKILFVLAAMAAILSSCTEEYAEPIITWTPNDLSNFVTIGDESTYNKTLDMSFSAEAGISDIEITKLVYKGLDLYYDASAVSPTGYSGLVDFDYNFTTTNVVSDFADGVTKIIYEVVLTDASETPQETFKEYTFFVDEAYTVTFNVENEAGNEITDAKVTFDGAELTAAPYAFEFVPEGTYEYTVEKDGFETVSVTDFVMADYDTTVNVVLVDLLSAYSDSVFITQAATSNYATYNGDRVYDTENTTIGVKYDSNTDNTIVIKPTTNCEGFVVVDNDSYTSYIEIVNAYTDGTALNEIELERDYDSKVFAEKLFVSKVDGAYVLVKYIDGFVNPTAHDENLGNVVVFQYKN